MKFLAVMTCALLFYQHAISAEESVPLFFKTTLAENFEIHRNVVIDYVKKEGTCLFINIPKKDFHDFEGKEWISEKETFDRIFALGVNIEDLPALFEALNPGGKAVLFYLPKESPHFDLLPHDAKDEPAALSVSRHEYKKAVEEVNPDPHGLNISIYRGLAFYPNKRVLIEEIEKEKVLWGEVSESQLDTLMLSLPEDKKIAIPFKILNVIVKRSSDL